MAIIGYDQVLKASGSMGGALVVFEGQPQLLVGGFDFDLSDLPGAGVVLPCGTPVNCDEASRKITPLITLKVKAVDGTDAKKVELVSNGFNGPALKVGDKVAIINNTLDHEYTNTPAAGADPAVYTFVGVAEIDGFNIVLDNALDSLAANSILVVVKENETTHKAAIKAVPNALLPYDKVYDAAATIVRGDGMIGNDMPVLERRMPPITDAIKAAVQANGHKITFSNRK